jgi:hypothetical protein
VLNKWKKKGKERKGAHAEEKAGYLRERLTRLEWA